LELNPGSPLSFKYLYLLCFVWYSVIYKIPVTLNFISTLSGKQLNFTGLIEAVIISQRAMYEMGSNVYDVGFEVPTAVVMKSTIFWDVTL
jgi:hypothetical protein